MTRTPGCVMLLYGALILQGCEGTSVDSRESLPEVASTETEAVDTQPSALSSDLTHSIIVEHLSVSVGMQSIFGSALSDLSSNKKGELRYFAKALEVNEQGETLLTQKPLPTDVTKVVFGDTQDIIWFNRDKLVEDYHIISIVVVDVFEEVLPVSIVSQEQAEIRISLESKESVSQVFLKTQAQEDLIVTSISQQVTSTPPEQAQKLLENFSEIVDQILTVVEAKPLVIEDHSLPDLGVFFRFPWILRVTSSVPDGVYGVGSVIPIQVIFSESVRVTGEPTLTLGVASLDRVIFYESGSGSNTLVFLYRVAAGDESEDLDYTGVGALALNGGSITSERGFPANPLLPEPGTPGSLSFNQDITIKTTPPRIVGVESLAEAGFYGIGRDIEIDVVFNEPVRVVTEAGSPVLFLETGVVDHGAAYISAQDNKLRFLYRVQPGDESVALDYVSREALELSGSVIMDTAGNPADTILPEVGTSALAQQGIAIDGLAPQGLRVSSSIANGAYRAGVVIPIEVVFPEIVVVLGMPRLALALSDSPRYALYVSGDHTNSLLFHYEVQEGDNTEDLEYVNASALDVIDGHIEDRAGNWAVLTLPEPGAPDSLSANKDIVIDTRPPQVTRVFSSSQSKWYGIGSQIMIIVRFDEVLHYGGEGLPALLLDLAEVDKEVFTQGALGEVSDVIFGYTVSEGDSTAGEKLDYVDQHALSLPLSASWVDRAGNPALLTLPEPGTLASLSGVNDIRIDGIRPRVARVRAIQPPGIYSVGQRIGIEVVFDEPVHLLAGDLLPTLELTLGFRNGVRAILCGEVLAEYLPPEEVLSCGYTILPKDMNADLDYTGIHALDLRGSHIQDIADNDALITLPALDSGRSLVASGIDVDTLPAFDRELMVTADDQQQADARFGQSVDISSHEDQHWTIVGAPDQNVDGKAKAGSVFIYGHDGEAWISRHEAQMVAPNLDDIREQSYFGTSVAIDASTQKAVVGMPGPAGNTGKAYVYAWDGTTWNYEARLRVTPDDDNWFSSGAAFGASVDIAGNLIIVGAPKHVMPTESGRAYIFENTHDEIWELRAMLSSGAEKAWSDHFGQSVAIASVGDRHVAFIGTPGRDSVKFDQYHGDNLGAVYVFATSDVSLWPEYVVRLTGQATGGDYFGRSVSLSGAGLDFVAAVGAYLSDEHRVDAAGSAYIFRSTDGVSWAQEARVSAGSEATRGALFGESISIDGDRVVIGASQQGKDALGYTTHAGAAYLFRYKRGAWVLHTSLVSAITTEDHHFGTSVSISEDMAVIGAPDVDADTMFNAGVVSIFE